MSSRRSHLARVLRTLSFTSAVAAGVVVGTVSSAAFAQSITAGADRTLSRLCAAPCTQSQERVAVDAAGNAIAVWKEEKFIPPDENSAGQEIRELVVSRYNVSTNSWSTPRILPKTTSENLLTYPQVEFDGSGNALIVWGEREVLTAQPYVLRYARYVKSQGSFTSPMTVERSENYNLLANLTVAKNGNAFLLQLGEQFRPGHYYDAATGTWQRLPNTTEERRYMDSAVDEVGNTIVTYERRTSTSLSLFATRFNFSSKQFGSPTKLDEVVPGENDISDNVVTRDRFGNDTVLWQTTVRNLSTGAYTRTIKSARYVVSRGAWVSKPIQKLNNNEISSVVDMDTDRSGNVAAIWTQFVGSYRKPVTIRYSSTTGNWSAPRVLSVGNFNTRDASIEASANGDVIATWSQRTDSGTDSGFNKIFRTKAVRYSAAAGNWGAPITVQDANVNSYYPVLDVDAQGRAVIIWNEDTPATDDFDAKRLRADRVFPQ